MIFVDNRAGSCELIEPLRALGLDVDATRLTVGDLMFAGHDGHDIGIEYKKLPELIQSIRDGRLVDTQASQMLGERGAYDYAWLLVEGEWIANKAGIVCAPCWRGKRKSWEPVKGKMNASEMTKRLLTLEVLGGLHVRFTSDRRSSVGFIRDLYRWFVDKSLADHTTLLSAHTSSGFLPISDFRAVVKDRFPGIGLRASLAVERRFEGSLQRACNAGVAEWAGIEVSTKTGSKRLGSKVAERILRFVRGEV